MIVVVQAKLGSGDHLLEQYPTPKKAERLLVPLLVSNCFKLQSNCYDASSIAAWAAANLAIGTR
jgi:hypothetical protein